MGGACLGASFQEVHEVAFQEGAFQGEACHVPSSVVACLGGASLEVLLVAGCMSAVQMLLLHLLEGSSSEGSDHPHLSQDQLNQLEL